MKTDQKSLFAQRLIATMQSKGYEAKPSILEREFNLRYAGKSVTFACVSKWLKGMAMPSGDKIIALAEWLEVSPEELAFDKDIQKAIEQREARWQQEIGYKDKEVFDAFVKLPTPQKKIVREVILAFAKAYAVKK